MGEYSFQEVIKQLGRMCEFYKRKLDCPMGCSMNGVDISQCRKMAFQYPEDTEKIVMKWASEHPENPTMASYLSQFGITIRRTGDVEMDFFKANEPMSDEMAKLLGIKTEDDT